MATQEVFVIDVLKSVIQSMQVPVIGSNPVSYFSINFEPGRSSHILQSLAHKDGSSLGQLKYPLVAAVMPISEKNGSGFLDVTFPRIVFAHMTSSNSRTEFVVDKYESTGVFKSILRPCVNEFIKRLAFSVYTNMGDPEAYEFTAREEPCHQPIGQGLNDYVDIIEVLNLKATIFNKIKSC